MAATVSTMAKRAISRKGSWRKRATMTMSSTSTMVTRMRKLPMEMIIFWKWLRSSRLARLTRETTDWKRVRGPVLTTTARISPCLTTVLA